MKNKEKSRTQQRYYAIFKKEAETWLEEYTGDLNNINHNDRGYWKIDLEGRIRERIKEKYPEYRFDRDFFRGDFYSSAIYPIINAATIKIESWYKENWRKAFVDFKIIPPAPRTLPKLVKESSRAYVYGPLRIKITGDKEYRQIELSATCAEGGYRILNIQSALVMLNKRNCLENYMSIIKAVYRVCAWDEVLLTSFPMTISIKKKLDVVKDFYRERGIRTA